MSHLGYAFAQSRTGIELPNATLALASLRVDLSIGTDISVRRTNARIRVMAFLHKGKHRQVHKTLIRNTSGRPQATVVGLKILTLFSMGYEARPTNMGRRRCAAGVKDINTSS